MSAIRAAIVGMGGMGQRHLKAVELAGMQATAICDLSPQRLDEVQARSSSELALYTEWATLIEQESSKIDVLIIATNGPTHAAITEAAVEEGVKYILCEKPMATNGRDARKMASLCRKADVRLAVNLSRRFADRFIRLREFLQSGVIGDIVHVNTSVGAGGLGCIGTHYFDFVSWLADTRAQWVSGDIDKVSAPNVRGDQFYDPGGCGMVGYENGMTASYQFSGAACITPIVQIIGSHGYVDFNSWAPPNRGWIHVYARPKDEWDTLKTRFVEPQRIEFDPGLPMDVVDASRVCLEDLVKHHEVATVDAGIEMVDIVMAFHLSSKRDGERVYLPLSGDDLDYDVPIT